MPETLPVGANCQWFPHADINQEPRAAIVTASTHDGILNIAVLPKHSITFHSYSGVRHVDDPWLKDHPDAILNKGGWAAPGTAQPKPPRKKGQIPGLEARRLPKDNEEEELCRLADQGRSSTEIAELMSVKTGEKWSYQRVNTTLRHLQRAEVS